MLGNNITIGFYPYIELLEFNGKKPILKNLIIEPIMLSDQQNQQLEEIMKSKKGNIYKRFALRKVMINNELQEAQGDHLLPPARTYRLIF